MGVCLRRISIRECDARPVYFFFFRFVTPRAHGGIRSSVGFTEGRFFRVTGGGGVLRVGCAVGLALFSGVLGLVLSGRGGVEAPLVDFAGRRSGLAAGRGRSLPPRVGAVPCRGPRD